MTPRGSPIDSLVGGAGPFFATANFKFEVHILPIDDLPSLGGTPLLTINSPAPPKALALFKELVKQLEAKELSIHPNPPQSGKAARIASRKVLAAVISKMRFTIRLARQRTW